jgi:hypothetical protein
MFGALNLLKIDEKNKLKLALDVIRLVPRP